MEPSKRNALIGNHVPFVIPGRQFYFPPMLDLKEWSAKPVVFGEFLSYSAQAVVLRELLFKDVAKTHTIPIGDDFVRIEDFDINQLHTLKDIKDVWVWLNKVVEYNISDEILNDFKVNHRELLKNRILLKAMLSEIRK